MKILIIDDDGVCRKILMIMLKNYGSCHQAVSSEETISLFRQSLEGKEPYDVMFLEVTLQGTDGGKILKRVRQVEEEFGISPVKRIPCIMISTETKDRVNEIMDRYEKQWDGYLVKPISPESLKRELLRLKLTGDQVESFNRQQLLNLMIDVGDKALVRELVNSFMFELPEIIVDMQKKLLEGDYSYIQKRAHKLVSLSGTYGFSQLSELLRTMEQGAIREDERVIEEGTTLVMQEWKKIQEELADLLAVCEVHNGK